MATFNTIIIEAADQEDANTFWAAVKENGMEAGPNTFTVGLVPADGPANATPATHYFGSGQLERYFPTAFTEFPVQFPNAVMLRYVGNSSGNLAYVNAELAVRNLQRQTSGI